MAPISAVRRNRHTRNPHNVAIKRTGIPPDMIPEPSAHGAYETLCNCGNIHTNVTTARAGRTTR
eukprot:2819477-Lingulodinium_polyedra.AAC.1